MNQELLKKGLGAESVMLDLREDLKQGKEPFGAIMQAVKDLKPGQSLAVRAIFEPKPLLAMLAKQGFHVESGQLGVDDWLSVFVPQALRDAQVEKDSTQESAPFIDVRGLEPPEPLVRILARCKELEPGACLEVIHERRPEMLYPKLEAMGFQHSTVELAEDSYRIFITRPKAVGA